MLTTNSGWTTTPSGLNLIVGMVDFKESFGTLIRATMPFVVLMLLALMVVVAWPDLTLFFTR